MNTASNILLAHFFAWPVLLLIVRIRRPDIPLGVLWLSVPPISWITVNGALLLSSYRHEGAGGGFGAGFNLVAAWIYMIPIFGILIGAHALWKRPNRSIQK